jgi:hypothetical protein
MKSQQINNINASYRDRARGVEKTPLYT